MCALLFQHIYNDSMHSISRVPGLILLCVFSADLVTQWSRSKHADSSPGNAFDILTKSLSLQINTASCNPPAPPYPTDVKTSNICGQMGAILPAVLWDILKKSNGFYMYVCICTFTFNRCHPCL